MAELDMTTLSFGAPAAERDIDQGLADYFVESAAFNRVAARSKTVVLGNRGTGKSAIFKVLAKRESESGAVVIELSPEDYSYEMLTQVLASEAQGSWAKLGAYAVAWKYLIWVLIMKGLNASGPRLRRGGSNDIYRYLRDHHANMADNPIGALISYLKRMEGIKLGKVEAALKARELERLYRLEEIQALLPAIQELCSSRKVVVLVDELDRGWDASEDARGFVAGLFQACMSINALSDNLTVYMSLRQELYDSIPELYEDAQKFRDVIETISWDEASLLALVAERIRYSQPALRGLDDESVWSHVFAGTLDYRQNKSFNYIVDRTLYRPREIIQFCSFAKDLAESSPVGFPLDYAVISEAERNYSTERSRDVSAEYRFQYPGLLSVFEVFRGRVYTFDRQELETLCLELALGDKKIDESAETWVADADPDRLIEILWEVGFLRAQAVGGIKGQRRSGSQYLGPHQVAVLNLRNVSRFQVHPMFRTHLGSKEPKRQH
ncbi:MAG: ATP-binding protein [Actinomycetota bacterium]|nr:ATP-binding protein [Actinomycetota bacterium]